MIPKEEELLEFIKKNDNMVNFSMIAKKYEINNATVSDIIKDMLNKKLVKVKQIGGSKIVTTKK